MEHKLIVVAKYLNGKIDKKYILAPFVARTMALSYIHVLDAYVFVLYECCVQDSKAIIGRKDGQCP